MTRTQIAAALAALSLAAPAAAGEAWSLDGASSSMGFVTIKNGDTAESHSFSDLSGSVADDGTVEVTIPLASVETLIDIRNERMREFLFNVAATPEAVVAATIDMDALSDLGMGERRAQEVEVTLKTNGTEADYYADVVVTRVGENAVAVSTSKPMIADARDLGYEGGVAKLQELAGLDAISPAVPVTFDLMFTR